MPERSEEQGPGEVAQPEPGEQAGQVGGSEGEGARNAAVTPRIGEDANAEQTQSPSPSDDVGVPSDEEIAEEEREADDA